MLYLIHAQTCRYHDRDYDEQCRDQLLLFLVKDVLYDTERIGISTYPEEFEYPHDPEESECSGSGRSYRRDEKGQE